MHFPCLSFSSIIDFSSPRGHHVLSQGFYIRYSLCLKPYISFNFCLTLFPSYLSLNILTTETVSLFILYSLASPVSSIPFLIKLRIILFCVLPIFPNENGNKKPHFYPFYSPVHAYCTVQTFAMDWLLFVE